MIGSPGGMGQVFAAQDFRLGRQVAIKVPALNILLALGGAERFLREAHLAERLGPHSHIVRIYACLTDPNLKARDSTGIDIDIPFVVMEYLDGGDLARLLKQGPLNFNMTAALFDQLCSAIQYAHSHVYQDEGKIIQGVVRRDLKPENICFDDEGRLVVVDFGIARLLGEVSSTLGMTGTPSHMAPEQWNPARGIDHRTDIYFLGVVLFQIVTGRLPFVGTLEAVMTGHLTQPPPNPRELRPELPEGVAQAILKALEKDKSARFDNVEQFGQAVAVGFSTIPSPLVLGAVGISQDNPTFQAEDENQLIEAEKWYEQALYMQSKEGNKIQ
jgi:serine/threonine-protein kinase